MKRIFLLIAIVLLLISGCDRYDNEFEKSLTDFFADFSDAVQTIHNVDQLEVFMQYYDGSYLNDGSDYTAKRDWYQNLLEDLDWDLHVMIHRFSEGDVSRVQWTLFGTIDNNDTNYSWTFYDCVQKINDEYKFVGNGSAQAFQTFRICICII